MKAYHAVLYRGVAFALFFLLVLASPAAGARLSAYEIMKKSEDMLNRAKDSQADMLMTLVNDKGQKRERSLKAYAKKCGPDRSKTILFFSSPGDVKGTSFLVWGEGNESDRQWLYLPALQRVRQINASGKGESFMGTELTFFDMGRHDVDNNTYTLLKEEPLDAEMCYVIETVPKKKEFYSKVVVWVRMGNFIPSRSDFYNLKNELEKQGRYLDIKDIRGIATPTRTEMRNVRNGRATFIELTNIVYDKGLSEDMFTERYMQRGN